MRKARLLFTSECNKNCKGCCNKDWKGPKPTPVTLKELYEFDEINITGGEPMLYPDELIELVELLKCNDNKVYLYTAQLEPYSYFLQILDMIDGCSVTLHSMKDYHTFMKSGLLNAELPGKSLRLNVFPKVKIESTTWNIRPKVWIKDCPLPEGEEFVVLIPG